ncbi:hypothetical protein RUM43_010969 [Polyplax serrata]|uniref:Adipose-secreted signaling protein n=1 Tax=Polyplax serrata TaxID=468196 RepID=A0AAN8S3F6_POLSC
MNASAGRKGHVNFGCEDFIPKDNEITVREIQPGHIQFNLGFLQYHHTYNISVGFPKTYFLGYGLASVIDAAEKSAPNINCKILSINERDEDYNIKVEFQAKKERLLKEELVFCLDKETKIVLEFNSRVLGPGKGTPLLKNGIKCVGIDPDEISDVSDWQADA